MTGLSLAAIRSSVHYPKKRPFGVVEEMLDHLMPLVERRDGLFLELGVFKGDSAMKTADRIRSHGMASKVYGFDSFLGLPEDWLDDGFFLKGVFNLNGSVPKMPDEYQGRVEIVPGWFADTLPRFVGEVDGPAAFVHVDCDLYSSAKTGLSCLAPKIVEGTILLFDEIMGYHADSYVVQNGEYRAFDEFLEETDMGFDVLCHSLEAAAFVMRSR